MIRLINNQSQDLYASDHYLLIFSSLPNFNLLKILTHIGHSEKVFIMMRLLLILILTFSFQTLVKADDIRDFEIEGMSIGDSLLDYINKNDIKDQKLNYFTDKRKYYVIGIFDDLKIFDQVEIYLKSNDKDYQIKTITGMIKIENLKACLLKKKRLLKT